MVCSTRRLPLMPRCSISVRSPSPEQQVLGAAFGGQHAASRQLARQARGTGQRSIGWRNATPVTRTPSIHGATPRRVVSTSGSSGMS
jgi:hypothetical protein